MHGCICRLLPREGNSLREGESIFGPETQRSWLGVGEVDLEPLIGDCEFGLLSDSVGGGVVVVSGKG